LNDHVHEFHRQQDLLAQAKNHYRHCSTGITEKSQQLAQLTAELSRIKEEMEETGQNVTDGGWKFLFRRQSNLNEFVCFRSFGKTQKSH
jgi:hypothetical protein